MQFIKGIFKSGFNGQDTSVVAQAMIEATLKNQMTQAFYRREHDTIALLEAQGAVFTQEMLHIAVGFRDASLTRLCLGHNVKPNDDIFKTAIGHNDTVIFDMLAKSEAPSQQVLRLIARHGSEDMRSMAMPLMAAPTVEPTQRMM